MRRDSLECMQNFSSLPWLGLMGLLAACSSPSNEATVSAGGAAAISGAGGAAAGATAGGAAAGDSYGGRYLADSSSSGGIAGSPSSAGGETSTAGSAGASALTTQTDPTAGASAVIAASGSVTAISADTFTLMPAFSPSISDYYVTCASGNNAFSLTVTDDAGSTTTSVNLLESQAAVVGAQYWIRCLPHDFPPITVTKQGLPTPGYYLVDSVSYAAVLDGNGVPVWYAHGSFTANVDSQAVNQISYMPNSSGGFGTDSASEFTILSLATNTTTTVQAVNTPTDAHEFQTLPNGDHLLYTYPLLSGVDLTGLAGLGANRTMADCQIQELDAAGTLVWSWNASDHIDAVKESIEPDLTPVVNGVNVIDPFHCNSIAPDTSGNLLISVRHANALYYIERATGKIAWKVGGTAYNKDGADLIRIVNDPEAAFSMQHDARFRPNGDITLYDDHGPSSGFARGIEYAIDHTANTATVVFQFLGITFAGYEGGFRRYDDGESVIGWGSIPSDGRVVTEVDANGVDVLDIAFDGLDPTYRAVKVPLSQLDLGLMRRAVSQ